MGFFKPPRLPFEERPKMVTQNDLDRFRHHPGVSFLALSRLQELDLSACPKLTDSSITEVGVWRQKKSEWVIMAASPGVPTGGAVPGPPLFIPVHADRDHRRQPGVGGATLPLPHQLGPQPLPGDH